MALPDSNSVVDKFQSATKGGHPQREATNLGVLVPIRPVSLRWCEMKPAIKEQTHDQIYTLSLGMIKPGCANSVVGGGLEVAEVPVRT